MKYKWLNNKNNEELIVFFNGWGMDENVVKHLDPENYDVIMIYDYNSLDCNLDFLNIYHKKYLIAWSMGVMCATLFDIEYVSKTAINGTLKPVDNEFGIPKRIYDLTVKNFSPKGSQRFISTMFSAPQNIVIGREFENQKTELEILKTYKSNQNFKYDKIFISDNDKIIPTKNQVNFWKQEANLNSGHCPFFEIKKWSELL